MIFYMQILQISPLTMVALEAVGSTPPATSPNIATHTTSQYHPESSVNLAMQLLENTASPTIPVGTHGTLQPNNLRLQLTKGLFSICLWQNKCLFLATLKANQKTFELNFQLAQQASKEQMKHFAEGTLICNIL